LITGPTFLKIILALFSGAAILKAQALRDRAIINVRFAAEVKAES
jgi:hypothetical protein